MYTVFPLVLMFAIFSFSENASAQSDPLHLPLLTIGEFEYVGAFRLPADTFGDSDLNYSEGPLAYHAERDSIFIVGHTYQQAIAEFKVPTLTNSSTLSELEMAQPPLQNFSSVLDRATSGNNQSLDRIGGLAVIDGTFGPELVVNAYEYYDAAADNSESTLVIRDIDNLSTSTVDGYFEMSGGAGHTAGWISPVPQVWQSLIGSPYITGMSSGVPIIGRLSVGPSAFGFDPSAIVGTNNQSGSVTNTQLLDFSLGSPLQSDLENSSRENDLWTHLSRAVYGFIVPGSRTYATLGYSGGHTSGVCYKCTQNNDNLCGGYCAPDADDYYLYYWLWDVEDLVAVKNGQMNASDVRPYDYGEFAIPFDSVELGGGSFDPESGRLYLSVQRADTEQGEYSNPPVIVVYEFSPGTVAASAKIGKVGKKIIYCVADSESNMARIDVGETQGELVSVLSAKKVIIRAYRKTLARLNNAGSPSSQLARKVKKLRRARRRARKCAKGTLQLS
ncbi:MAG: hypothetical protein KDD55_04940 [Bdellovibrionales bacterium]|nr:hypothetical protein [Bdellovibrionales bacterium]